MSIVFQLFIIGSKYLKEVDFEHAGTILVQNLFGFEKSFSQLWNSSKIAVF